DSARPGDLRGLEVYRVPLLPGGVPVQRAALRGDQAGTVREEVRHVWGATGTRTSTGVRRSVSGGRVDCGLARRDSGRSRAADSRGFEVREAHLWQRRGRWDFGVLHFGCAVWKARGCGGAPASDAGFERGGFGRCAHGGAGGRGVALRDLLDHGATEPRGDGGGSGAGGNEL